MVLYIQRSKPKTQNLHTLSIIAYSFRRTRFWTLVCAIESQSLVGDVPTSVESRSLTESIDIPVEGAPCSRASITFLHVLLQVAYFVAQVSVPLLVCLAEGLVSGVLEETKIQLKVGHRRSP